MYFYISGNKYRLIKCKILYIIANINKLQYKYKKIINFHIDESLEIIEKD